MMTEVVLVCKDCGCEDFVNRETYFLVTGQVDGFQEEAVLADCAVCGTKQRVA